MSPAVTTDQTHHLLGWTFYVGENWFRFVRKRNTMHSKLPVPRCDEEGGRSKWPTHLIQSLQERREFVANQGKNNHYVALHFIQDGLHLKVTYIDPTGADISPQVRGVIASNPSLYKKVKEHL
jgi:hypothetical protein